MKKILSLFALLVAIVTGAQGSGVADLKTISSDHTVIFEDIMGGVKFNDGTLYDSDYLLSVGGNNYVTNKGKCSSLNNKYNCCRIKSASQDRLAFKVGDACTLKIYGETRNDRLPVLSTDGSATAKYEATHEDKAEVMTFTITEAGTYYIVGSGDRFLAGLEFDFADATTAPTFTTDLSATADVTVGVAEVFTVDTDNATSYQWYKDDAEIEGATDKTYSYTATAAGTVNIKCVATNNIGSTTSTVCAVTATAPTSAPTITTDLEAAYDVIKGKTLELSIVAEDASSYQWYKDDVAIEGATSTSYTFSASSTVGATNEIYCSAINAAGSTKSTVATITTVGRTDCNLTNVKFSNGAYGAIGNAAYGADKVAVPYMAGEDAPTVVNSSIKVSDGATYSIEGNTITVTAENGTDKKNYTVQAVEMTPLEVDEDVETTTFTAVPTWAFNLYGWDEGKGVKFAKKVDEASNMRIALGNTRLYMFISEAKSITLTSGSAGARNIKVYRNGEELSTPTATADKNETITIALDETASNMIMIESNQTGGDTGFTKYAIEKATPTINVVLGANGYSTFRPGLNVKLASGATVYTAKIQDGAVVLSAVDADAVIGYDEGVILKGTEGETAVFTVVEDEATELDNDLIGANALTDFGDYTYPYVLASKGTQTSFVKLTADYYEYMFGKAFIVYSGSQQSLEVKFDGATAVEAIAEANENASEAPVKVIKDGKLFIGNYNVAGQLVK